MVARIITGLIGLPIAITLIFLHGGLPFAVAIGVMAVLGISEFYRGAKQAGARPHTFVGIAGCILAVTTARFLSVDRSIDVFPHIFAVVFLFMLVRELVRKQPSPIKNIGATILGLAYVAGLFAHMVLLRGLPGTTVIWRWETEKGALLVFFVFITTWACDTTAYFIGRKYGKTKLVPRLSPGKTLEGSIAGFAGSFVVAAVAGTFIKLPIMHSLILGAMIGVLCQVGDLIESSMKREIGIKDFGAIMPGHGGILDRFDSLLLTSTATYCYAVYLLTFWLK